MYKFIFRLQIIALLALALFTTGCISTAPTPSYARSGDLVQIGLGGIKRNSTGKALTGADVTATITDSNSTVHNVDVSGLFRAYADHTSWYARDSLERTDAFFGNVEPYDGMWWATLKLTDVNVPLPLATGPATITITSPELVDTGWAQEGTLASFPIEIIAGTATPTTAQENQYAAYRHQRSLTIKPDDLTGVTEVGGFQVKLTYNTSAIGIGSGGASIHPRVVPLSHDPNINIIQGTVDNGDGTRTVTAMVTNPNGFVPNANTGSTWAIGKSVFADLEFAVIAIDAGGFNGPWATNYWLEAADSYYVDGNGNVIAGLDPVLGASF